MTVRARAKARKARRGSLVSRLTFGIAAAVFGTGVLVLLIATGNAYDIASQDLRDTVEDVADRWRDHLEHLPDPEGTEPGWGERLASTLALWVFDAEGTCLFPGPEEVTAAVAQEGKTLVESRAPIDQLSRESGSFRLCRTVEVDGERLGAVLVEADRGPLVARFAHQVGWGLAGILLLSFTVGFLSLRWLDRYLVRPLDTLLRMDRESLDSREAPRLVPIERIPDNELGQVMDSRNRLLLHLGSADREAKARGHRLSEYRRWLNHRGFDLEVRVRDTTRMVLKAQERLLQSEKLAAIGKLVSGIAHEINNPLAAIAGHAEDLLELAESDMLAGLPEFHDFPGSLRVIEEQAYRCKTILQRLLNFARQADVAIEPIDLKALFEDCLALVESRARPRGLRLEPDLSKDLGAFVTDRVHLQQVVINLLDNAIDASAEGGCVTLRAWRTDTHVHLIVADEGAGIDPEWQGRVFDPFFTTKPVGEGTGMGLAICYGVVRRLGGVIEFESELGRGTEFSVTLPGSRVVEDEEPGRPSCREPSSNAGVRT